MCAWRESAKTARISVRLLEHGQLRRALLCSEGGPFSLGAVVELGSTRSRGVVPQVEDVTFIPRQVKPEKMLDGVKFGEIIKSVAKSSLRKIFGDDLVSERSTSAAVPEGAGKASLGVLRVEGDANLRSSMPFGEYEIRFTFADPDLGELSLKVNDLRLWKTDHVTPAFSKIEDIRTRLTDCLVAVGFTRAYRVSSYPGPRHWLQVNNIFPIDDPLWARE